MGPDIVVLGDIARLNGLGTSLLHRLSSLYLSDDAMRHSIMLCMNHRSHINLFNLSCKLFYKTVVLTTAVEAPSDALKFICSDLSNQVGEVEPTNDYEVQLILSEVDKVKDPSNSCIMTTNLRQVCLNNIILVNYYYYFIEKTFFR